MWIVDGTRGGGQILRTALGVAALRGIACRIESIRATRPRPGLQRSHLAAVQAVGRAVGGRLEGATLHSRTLVFQPGDQTGELRDHIDIGTAGSTTLVLQALLPLLLRQGGELRITGGTDNPFAPPIDFTIEVLVPALRAVGYRLEVARERRGYYPKGGGHLLAAADAHDRWPAFERLDWGGMAALGGIAYSSLLPGHVVERLHDTALRTLKKGLGLTAAQRETLRQIPLTIELDAAGPATSPGAGIVLWAEDGAGRRIAGSGLGERGVPAERVAEAGASLLLEELAAEAPCDRHLGDQLALYAALADGPCAWRVSQVTDHLTSSLELLAEGLGVGWSVEGTVVRRVDR